MSRKDTLRRIDQGIPGAGSAAVSVTLAGSSGGVSNADTVDGYHASSTRTAGKLLALDANARFTPAVIDWSSVAGAGLGASGNTLVVQWGASPTTIVPDASANGGSAATSARSDHRHAIAAAVAGSITPDAMAAEGTSTSFARADHVHGIAAAVAGSITPDATAAEGTSTSFARADHVHGIAAAVAGSIQPDDAAAEGTSMAFARSDHRHAIAAAAPDYNLHSTSTNYEGVATSFARSDHRHAIAAYADASVYPAHLLKSDVNGDLKVRRLEASDRLIASLVKSATGTGLTLQPNGDLILDPDSNLAKVANGVRLQSDGYASQTTGWGIGYNGAADFRYLYVDEMHAKAFVADLEQALAGGQIIAKSVAPLQSNFTVPAPGASEYLWVESFAGFPDAQVFENGDTVMVRTFGRTGTSLTIGNAFGTVSSGLIVTGENRQRWTFTRLSGTVGGMDAGGTLAAGTVIPTGTLALDFGVSGNGYYEVNAIDGAMGANSPYAQIVTWNAHPWYDRTVRTRYGNLYGVFASAGEYGMFAGNGAANADQFLRLSNQAIEGHNLPIRLYDGATQVVRIEPNAGTPYIGLGNPAPTGYLGASGIWMGKHSSAYKAHIGTISGGDVAAGWKWDGTTLTVRGQIYVTGGDAAKTDLSNVAANTVTGKVNDGSTLIQPGRILISGSTTLSDWRHPSGTTLIDGGKIQAGSIVLSGLDPGGQLAGQNLLMNSSFTEDSNGDGISDHWAFNYGYAGTGFVAAISSDTYVYDGLSMKLEGTRNHGDGGYLAAYSHTVAVHSLFGPGKKFAAGIWIRKSSDTGATDTTQLLLRALNSSGGYISDFGSTWTTTPLSQWTYLWCTGTAPAGTYYLQVVLRHHQTNNGETALIYLDGATLSVGEYPIAWSAAQRGNVFIDGTKIRVGTRTGARVEINSSGIEGYKAGPIQTFDFATDGSFWFGAASGSGSLVYNGTTFTLQGLAQTWIDSSGNTRGMVDPQAGEAGHDYLFWLGPSSGDKRLTVDNAGNVTVKGQILVTGGDAAKTNLSNVTANWGKVGSPGGNAAGSASAGGAASDAASIAATPSNDVVDKVNDGSTLIQPGRILISGSTTLDDWRHPSNYTLIDGGKIQAGSIVLSGLDPGGQLAGQNLLMNSSFTEDSNGDGIPDGWSCAYGYAGTGFMATISGDTYVYDGLSLKLEGTRNHADGGYLQLVSTQIAVHSLFGPGKKFAAGIWIRKSSDTGATDTTQLLLRALNSSSGYISDFGSTSTTTPISQWTYLWCTGTAPAGTCYLQVLLRHHQTGNEEQALIYLDGATLSVGEYPIAWSAAQRGNVFIDGTKIRVGTRNGARVEVNSEGITGYSNLDTKQFYMRTDNGRAMFGGGEGVLDASGLVLSGDETQYYSYNAVRWMTQTNPAPGGIEVARIAGGRTESYSGTYYPVLSIETNRQQNYAYSSLYVNAWGDRNTAYGGLALYGTGNAGSASLQAANSVGMVAVDVSMSGSTRMISFTAHTSQSGYISGQNLYMHGNIDTGGQVNMVRPYIVIPIMCHNSIALTGSYQEVMPALQTFDVAFTAMAGRDYTSQTGWNMYVIIPVRFSANPTTIRAALWHYTGDSWQYHPSTYTYTTYANGRNYNAWGPWPVSQVSQTMTIHMKTDTGTGATWGPNEGGQASLLFVRS